MLNLKKIRESKGISQAAVARDLQISRQTYNNYELGKREADYETLLKLAEYFDITVDTLLSDKEKSSNPVTSTNLKIPIYGSFQDKCLYIGIFLLFNLQFFICSFKIFRVKKRFFKITFHTIFHTLAIFT